MIFRKAGLRLIKRLGGGGGRDESASVFSVIFNYLQMIKGLRSRTRGKE